jgi:hypothetical protein
VTALLVTLVSAAYLAGLSWFVAAVHYPLFAAVGPDAWPAYHQRHSDRTTVVVAPALAGELGGAAWTLVARPDGVGAAAAAAGLALAAGAWALTALAAVPAHRRLAGGYVRAAGRRLERAHLARTLLWTAHAALAAVLAGAAAG